MSSDLRIENVLIQVRSKLNENNIKLWLSPYFDEITGPCEAELNNLSIQFSVMLSIAEEYCLAAIKELQNNAIDKLQTKAEFELTGIATLKARIPDQPGGTKLITVKQPLSNVGSDLKHYIAEEIKISPSRIKIIFSGRVVKDEVILQDQGLLNNQQILVLITQQSPGENESENLLYDQLKNMKADAEILMQGNDSFMQMEDQAGNAVHMPSHIKKQLMMALALHEKGKSAMKKDKFNEALMFFLEADGEYSKCEKHWLDAVDNFAILNLDIVWCYLRLKSMMQLPDAERRLKLCEKNFRKSYGENMDRVIALKGSSQNEKALIMRLHLLQAVLCFHQNRRNEAQEILLKADAELKKLKINEDNLKILIDMGYTTAEARIGLRSCGNDINESITFILNQRETRNEARKKAKEERDLEKLIQPNTSSSSENWVNPRNLHILTEMGFPKMLCVLALKKSKNNVADAIKHLQDNRDALIEEFEVSKDNLQELEKMGFHEKLCEAALKQTFGNLDEAVEYLIKLQSDGTYESLLDNLLANPLIANSIADGGGPSTSNNLSNIKNVLEFAKKDLEKNAALERFSDDLNLEDDNYLDLSLEHEEQILNEYKKYLNLK